MVALDDGSIARAGLDDVGVDRALGEIVDAPDLFCLVLKDADELLADALALALRLRDPGELAEEAGLGIDADEVQEMCIRDRVTYQVQFLCAAVLCAVAAHRVLCRNTRMKNGLAAVRLPNISHLADFVINNGLSGIDLAALIEICLLYTSIKEAIAAAFPDTEYQRCLVHQVRNTLKYVADKDKKLFSADLKKIYKAASEQSGRDMLDTVSEKWSDKYPNAMKSWYKNWDAITPIFKFSSDVRTIIYTTNAIESLNSQFRRLNAQRSVFPSDQALLKALYLSTFEATKKWTMSIRNWGKVYGELSIMYEGRLTD